MSEHQKKQQPVSERSAIKGAGIDLLPPKPSRLSVTKCRKRPFHAPTPNALSTENPSSSGARGKSCHAVLLLLMPKCVHASSTTLDTQLVSPESFAEMVRTKRSTPTVARDLVGASSCTSLPVGRWGCRVWRCWQICLPLAFLNPFALNMTRHFDKVANKDLNDGAHGNDNVVGNRLRDGCVNEL